ncbi:MAG: enoyl-CoA hydratase-related protein [Suipraeoptans sp.]
MQYVKIEKLDDVNAALVTISREKALNALNNDVLKDIDTAFDEVEKSYDVSSVIITGEGDKSFVAGADIAHMRDLNKKDAQEFSRFGSEVFSRIENFPIPVIAAINGYALGGGLELAIACDFRIASENALFACPEVGLGIIPGFGGTQRLMRVISVGKAKEMIYSGERIDASKAKEIGLVNAKVTSAELIEYTKTIAKRIAKNSLNAVKIAKKAMNDGAGRPIVEGISIETMIYPNCYETKDQVERMTAFVNKSKK